MEQRREQVLGLLWWAAMAGVSWLVLRYALVWLLPFLLALGAAALQEPLIVRAQRRLHLRRSFTAAVLTLVLVGGVLAVLIALAVQLVEQAVALVSSLPELLAALPETMASLERRLEGFCAACPDGVRQTAEHMLDSLPRRAAELAGITDIPCIIMSMDDRESGMAAMVENLQRQDLDFIEEAMGISRLLEDWNMSQEQAARKVGKSQSAVANKLRLLRLSPSVLASRCCLPCGRRD